MQIINICEASGKPLSILSKSILKPGSFFIWKSCLKVEKIKMSEFQKMYVRRPGSRKHSFFIS